MEHGILPRRAELGKFQSMFLTFPEGFVQAVGLYGMVRWGSFRMEKWWHGEESEGNPSVIFSVNSLSRLFESLRITVLQNSTTAATESVITHQPHFGGE